MHNGKVVKGSKGDKGGSWGKDGGILGKAAGTTYHNADDWKLVYDAIIYFFKVERVKKHKFR
jgi:hypothetical protein